MNVNELIALLRVLPESEKRKPVLVELEKDILVDLKDIRYQDGRWVILSVFPAPFLEALWKAGIE